MTSKPESEETRKIVSENRKARHEYHILDVYEAGMILSGDEVKSIRATGISIAESYVRPINGEVFLLGAHINPYSYSGKLDYLATGSRKLLLNRSEINKLIAGVERKGFTIVPLKVYFKNGLAKIEIALAKGKDAPDKRQAIKAREADRDMKRAARRERD